MAGTTAAGHSGREKETNNRVVAEAGRAIGRAVAYVGGEKRPGARVIPWNLGNIRNGRTKRGGVTGIPIGGVGAGIGVTEIGAADGHVVGSRSESVDGDAVSCLHSAIVTASRAAVTGGNENGDPFGDGLLISGVVGGVGGCAVDGFTLAITDAHDGGRRSAGIDEVFDGDQAAEGGAGVCAGGYLDGGAWGGGTSPFSVEDGFPGIESDDAGSAAVIDGLRGRCGRMDLREGGGGVAGEAESLTEVAPVRSAEYVSVLNEHNGLVLAGNARAEERVQVVNLGQVRGHDREIGAAEGVYKCEFRVGLMQMVHRMRAEVVQRDDAGYDGSESGGNSRIADVTDMLLAFDFKAVNFCLEGFVHLGGGAGKIDEHAAGIDDVDAEPLEFEPAGDGVEVRLRQAEAFAEFLRGHPVMEVWRAIGVEFVDELLEGLFLFRRALQLEQHVVHGEIVGHGAAIVRRPRFGMGVARECDAICFIDALHDSRAGMQAGFDLRTGRR